MINLLIFLIVGYVVYRLIIRRIRWRPVRVLLYVPILVIVAFTIITVTEMNRISATPTREAIAAAIVDSQPVRRGTLTVSVTGTGTVLPMRQVPLTFSSLGVVAEVAVEAGQTVQANDLLARLDTGDFQQIIDNATIALNVQQSAYEALTMPSRQVDVDAAEAALAAARAQYYAAASTAPTNQQEEITRLQFELAKNQNYQLQLQRDALTPPDLSDFNLNLEIIPKLDPSVLPPNLQSSAADINAGIDSLNSGLSATLSQGTIQQGQAVIAQVEAQRRQIEGTLDEAQTNADISEQRYQATLSRGPDSGAVAAANASIVQAQVALDRLLNGANDTDLAQADLNVKLAQNALAQAQQSVTNADLRAPFDGVIARNNLTAGEQPPQGIALLLMDTSGYLLDLPIDETDVVRVSVGQRVEISVDALPDAQVSGVVTRLAYTPVRIGQLVTYNVRIALDPTEAALRVGMSVTATIITDERPAVLIVPNRFIRVDPVSQNAFVTLQAPDGAFREALVILGARNDSESEILSGVSEEDRVVLLPRGTEGIGGFFN